MTNFQMAVAYFFAASFGFGVLWAIFGDLSKRPRDNDIEDWEWPRLPRTLEQIVREGSHEDH